jgi:hypothetical protein
LSRAARGSDERQAEGAPRAPAGQLDGGTPSQRIASVRPTGGDDELHDAVRFGAVSVVVLAVVLLASCGGRSPVASSRPSATPAPSPSPVPFAFTGLARMTVAVDPSCADSFPASRREREYVVSVPPTSNPEVLPAFVDARVYHGSGTILGGGYRPMLRLRYIPPDGAADLDFGEFVSDHERMMFLGTASFAPFLPLPSCARFDGTVSLSNDGLSLEYGCASRNHRVCVSDLE